MSATFFAGDLDEHVESPAQLDAESAYPDVACRSFFHECNAWALREILGLGVQGLAVPGG